MTIMQKTWVGGILVLLILIALGDALQWALGKTFKYPLVSVKIEFWLLVSLVVAGMLVFF